MVAYFGPDCGVMACRQPVISPPIAWASQDDTLAAPASPAEPGATQGDGVGRSGFWKRAGFPILMLLGAVLPLPVGGRPGGYAVFPTAAGPYKRDGGPPGE